MTLALAQVFRQHEDLREGFVRWIFEKVPTDHAQQPPARVRVIAQVSTDCGAESADGVRKRSRPDIRFVDDERPGERVVLIVENKFFSGLTCRQPVDYINLTTSGLVFVTPNDRLRPLKDEYFDGCDRKVTCRRGADNCFLVKDAQYRKFVLFLSWEDLLDHLYKTALKSGAPEGMRLSKMSDVSQLEGIRERMEGERIDTFPLMSWKILGKEPAAFPIWIDF